MKIAIIGATGVVGSTLAKLIYETKFPFEKLELYSQFVYPIYFGHKIIYTKLIDFNALKDFDLIFNCSTADIAKQIPEHMHKDAWLIDKTSQYRMVKGVPLIVPEINPTDLEEARQAQHHIVSSPNCVAIPLALALKPILAVDKIQHCFVSTYQSVSGAGSNALRALSEEQKDEDFELPEPPKFFKKHIASNVLPHIDSIAEDGWTGEELKIIEETQRLLGTKMLIDVTCVRVPVPIGHCASVHLVLEKNIKLEKIVAAFEKAEGVILVEGHDRYVTAKDVVGTEFCFVSRLRVHRDKPNCLSFWIACDNLRKGAALNSLQIAQLIFGIEYE